MNRRGFLLGMLAAGAAPAIVKAANIMPVFVRKEAVGLLVPEQFVVIQALPGNLLLCPNTIAKEAIRIYRESLAFKRVVKIGDGDDGPFGRLSKS